MTTDATTIEIPADQYGRISGKTLADLLSRFANSGPNDVFVFADVVANDHRTLQQAATGIMLSAIVTMARFADEGHVDARNEASAAICQKIRDLLVAENVFIQADVVKFPLI